MNFYQRNIGDYARDCRFLTMIQDGAYTRLMDWYYKNEKPLPISIKECCNEVGASGVAERKAVAFILEKYFVLLQDGHHKNRCDEEIAAVYKKSDKARASAEARWERERAAEEHAIALRTHAERNANGMLPMTHDPLPSISTPAKPGIEVTPQPQKQPAEPKSKPVSHDQLVADGLLDDTAAEWLAHRRKKRAPLGQTAWDGIKAEAKKAGLTNQAAVAKALQRGWASFEASWVGSVRGGGGDVDDEARRLLGIRPGTTKEIFDA